jgi:hypothetical protein
MTKKAHTTKEDGISLASLANEGFKSLSKFAKSEKKEDKLIGFNGILFFLIVTLGIASGITTNFNEIFNILMFLALSALISAILTIGYLKIFDIISNTISNDEFAIKSAISLQFFSVSSMLIGFLYQIKTFINIGIILLLAQLIVALILGFLKLPVKTKIETKQDNKIDIWVILDRILICSGIINLIIGTVTIALKLFLK